MLLILSRAVFLSLPINWAPAFLDGPRWASSRRTPTTSRSRSIWGWRQLNQYQGESYIKLNLQRHHPCRFQFGLSLGLATGLMTPS